MKWILILFLLFPQMNNFQTIQSEKFLLFTISVPERIKPTDKNIKIKLRLYNSGDKIVKVRNPAHWVNSTPHISYEGKEVPMIKVKADLTHLSDFFQILPNQYYEVTYDFDLDRIVNLEYLQKGKYEIYFELYDNPKIKSNTLSFRLE